MSNDIPTLDNGTTLSDIVSEEPTAATSSDTAPEGASQTETSEDKAKRTYTSPRVNMGNEMLAAVALLRTAWESSEDVSKGDVLSVLSLVSEKITHLRDHGRDVVEGERRERSSTPNPYAGKHHFVGKLADGTLMYCDIGKRPTPANAPEGVCELYGAFNTRAGADYVVKNGLKDHHKRVF